METRPIDVWKLPREQRAKLTNEYIDLKNKINGRRNTILVQENILNYHKDMLTIEIDSLRIMESQYNF